MAWLRRGTKEGGQLQAPKKALYLPPEIWSEILHWHLQSIEEPAERQRRRVCDLTAVCKAIRGSTSRTHHQTVVLKSIDRCRAFKASIHYSQRGLRSVTARLRENNGTGIETWTGLAPLVALLKHSALVTRLDLTFNGRIARGTTLMLDQLGQNVPLALVDLRLHWSVLSEPAVPPWRARIDLACVMEAFPSTRRLELTGAICVRDSVLGSDTDPFAGLLHRRAQKMAHAGRPVLPSDCGLTKLTLDTTEVHYYGHDSWPVERLVLVRLDLETDRSARRWGCVSSLTVLESFSLANTFQWHWHNLSSIQTIDAPLSHDQLLLCSQMVEFLAGGSLRSLCLRIQLPAIWQLAQYRIARRALSARCAQHLIDLTIIETAAAVPPPMNPQVNAAIRSTWRQWLFGF